MIKQNDNEAVEAFLKAKRASNPNYGKVRASKGKGKSVYMLERQMEQNLLLGFGMILDCDLSRKQKEIKRNTVIVTEEK
jgi:hypothetical protein